MSDQTATDEVEITTLYAAELKQSWTRRHALEELRRLVVEAFKLRPQMYDTDLWRFYRPQMLPFKAMTETVEKLAAEGLVTVTRPRIGQVLYTLTALGGAASGEQVTPPEAEPAAMPETEPGTEPPAQAEPGREVVALPPAKRKPARKPKTDGERKPTRTRKAA